MRRWIILGLLFLFWFNLKLFSQFGYRDSATIKEDLNDSLLMAAYDGDFNRIIESINKGANVNAQDFYGQTPLMFVIQKRDLKLVKLLVERGANINIKPSYHLSSPPLIITARLGYLEIASYLLENKADVSIKDNYGASSIHYAALYNDSAFFELLQQYHADLNARTYAGESPLMLAAYNGSIKMVDELISKEVEVDAKDNKGFTPLMVAAQNGQYETVLRLLESWAIINTHNSNGLSALSLAIANGNTSIADLLLLNKANINEQNTLSINPLAIAQIYNQPTIVDSLRKMHARRNTIPYFRGIRPEISVKFNDKDVLTGVSFLTHDLKYNLEAGVHYYFRPSAISVLIQRGGNTYYQFWERRNILGLSLAKDFPLIVKGKKQFGFLGGINYDLNFGKYRGTDISINTNLFFTPFLGAYYWGNYMGYRLSYSYTNYNITGLSNWYAGFSIMYRFKSTPPDLNKKIKLLE